MNTPTIPRARLSAGARVPPSMCRGPVRRCLILAGSALIAIIAGACIPLDGGGNEAAMALEEVQSISYYMQEETALLQAQIDSLRQQVHRTDSLLRLLAIVTGNPIPEPNSAVIPPYIPPQ